MSNAFNPYREWLGLSEALPALTHYQLFGLPPSEGDPVAITHAADQALAKVRAIRPGEHAAAWSKLLDELRTAKACLLNSTSRADYDAGLRTGASGGRMTFSAPTESAAPMALPPSMQPHVAPTQVAVETTPAPVAVAPSMPSPSAPTVMPEPMLPPPPHTAAQGAPAFPMPAYNAPPMPYQPTGFPGPLPPQYPAQPYYGQPGMPAQPGMLGYSPSAFPHPHDPSQAAAWGNPSGMMPPQLPGLDPYGQPTYSAPQAYGQPQYPAMPYTGAMPYPAAVPLPDQPYGPAAPAAAAGDMSWLGSSNDPMPWDTQPQDGAQQLQPAPVAAAPNVAAYNYGYPAAPQATQFAQPPAPYAPSPYGLGGQPMMMPGPFAPAETMQPSLMQPGAYSNPMTVSLSGVPLPAGAPDPMAPVNISMEGMNIGLQPQPELAAQVQIEMPDSTTPGALSTSFETARQSNAGLYGIIGGAAVLAIAVAVFVVMNNKNDQTKPHGTPIAQRETPDLKKPDPKVPVTPQPDPTPAPPDMTPTPDPVPPPTPDPVKPNPANPDPPKPDPTKSDPPKPENPNPDPPKPDPPKPDPAKPDPPKPDPVKVDPRQVEQFNRLIGAVRISLTKRDLPAADKQLKELRTLAMSDEQTHSVGRMESLYQYVKGFWQAVREAMKAMKPPEEIMVGSSTRLIVAESGPNYIVVHVGGMNKRYTVDNLPSGLAFAIANQWFDKNPQNKLFIGAFYAVDEQGGLDRAKAIWEEAARSGVNIGDVMALLSNELKK